MKISHLFRPMPDTPHGGSPSGTARSKNALVFLRILVACLIAAHGWHRLLSPGGPADLGAAVTQFGFPAGLALGWLITLVEALGTPLFALGWLALPLGIFYTFLYSMAIIFYHAPHGWFSSGTDADGCEYAVLLVGALVGVTVQYLPARASSKR